MSEPAKKTTGIDVDQQPESYQPKKPEIVGMVEQARQPALEMQGEKRMEPAKFMQKGEFLLGGFHVGSDIGKRWKKYEREEKKAPLINAVDGTGFERRLLPTASVAAEKKMRNFTGVAVTDRNILSNYDLLVVPPAYYDKPGHAPESYQPQKPEIIGMVEENAGSAKPEKVCAVKTANGGSYIDGLPMLRWGEWKDCTYGGGIAAGLDLAIPT